MLVEKESAEDMEANIEKIIGLEKEDQSRYMGEVVSLCSFICTLMRL